MKYIYDMSVYMYLHMNENYINYHRSSGNQVISGTFVTHAHMLHSPFAHSDTKCTVQTRAMGPGCASGSECRLWGNSQAAESILSPFRGYACCSSANPGPRCTGLTVYPITGNAYLDPACRYATVDLSSNPLPSPPSPAKSAPLTAAASYYSMIMVTAVAGLIAAMFNTAANMPDVLIM